MAKRSDSQKIGSKGHRLVMSLIEDSGGWISRGQEEDFGIDVEAELDEPEVSGQIIKIQIKSTESIKKAGRKVKVGIEKKYLNLARNFRYPLIFVVADVVGKEAWYIWLQEYLVKQHRAGKKIEDFANETTVDIPINQTLSEGLKDRLKRIARWEEETQMLLTLLDTTRTAIATNNRDVMMSLGKIIEAVDKSFRNFPIEELISKLVEMNTQPRAFAELGLVSFLLGNLLREYGNRVSLDDILRMVLHGDTYSRTGISLLGTLYDYFPDHIAAFGLSKIFGELELIELVYYCELREKYLGVSSVDIIHGDYDYNIGNMTLDIEDKSWLMNKWANRGDTVFVDYLIKKK